MLRNQCPDAAGFRARVIPESVPGSFRNRRPDASGTRSPQGWADWDRGVLPGEKDDLILVAYESDHGRIGSSLHSEILGILDGAGTHHLTARETLATPSPEHMRRVRTAIMSVRGAR